MYTSSSGQNVYHHITVTDTCTVIYVHKQPRVWHRNVQTYLLWSEEATSSNRSSDVLLCSYNWNMNITFIHNLHTQNPPRHMVGPKQQSRC